MKVLGRTEVASFLRNCPRQRETLQAWFGEIQHQTWGSAEALAADFRSVDTTSPPLALFRMGQPTLLIETFVDFRNGVILVNAIREDIASVNLLN